MMKTSAKPHGAGAATPLNAGACASVADITRHARTRLLVDIDERAGEGVGIELPERGPARRGTQARAKRRIAGQSLDAARAILGAARDVGQRIHALSDQLVDSPAGPPNDAA